MFFDDPEKIIEIARNTGFSIFVLNQPVKISNKKTIKTAKSQTINLAVDPKDVLEVKDDRGKIRVDQIREIEDHTKTKATKAQFIIVQNAETMNEAAQNAFLKLLEEPKDNYHFVLFVNSLSSLLETVLSRGEIYVLKQENPLDRPLDTDDETIESAKKLLSANFQDLTRIAAELTDKKHHKNPREDTKKILATAIEILYKSYFKTKNPKFLNKLLKLINCYENIAANGHIKLHLVADLC